MEKKYCVIFVNLIKEKDHFISEMSGLGVDSATTAQILCKAPVILKANMSLEEAKVYAGAIIKAGGRVRIRDDSDRNRPICPSMKIMAFESFVMCPRCGYKQLRKTTCERCGFHFSQQDRND